MFEALAFASLISAVAPVATLATFDALQVADLLSMLRYSYDSKNPFPSMLASVKESSGLRSSKTRREKPTPDRKKTVIAALRVKLNQVLDSAALLNSRDNQSSHVVVAVLPRLG